MTFPWRPPLLALACLAANCFVSLQGIDETGQSPLATIDGST